MLYEDPVSTNSFSPVAAFLRKNNRPAFAGGGGGAVLDTAAPLGCVCGAELDAWLQVAANEKINRPAFACGGGGGAVLDTAAPLGCVGGAELEAWPQVAATENTDDEKAGSADASPPRPVSFLARRTAPRSGNPCRRT
jgi:hypothetical protein